MIRKTRDSSRGCLLLLQRATEGRLKLLKQCPARRPIQIVRSINLVHVTGRRSLHTGESGAMIAELARKLGYVARRGSFKQVTSDWARYMFKNREASAESVFVDNSVDDKTTINCSPCPCASFVSCGEFVSGLGGE